MIVPRYPVVRRHLAGLAVSLVLAPGLGAQQPERFTLAGERVAVYDLVGRVEVVSAPRGDVVVEVTRQGSNGSQLKVETGPLRGRETLRVIFPDDRIVYPVLERGGSSDFWADDDGTFGDGRRGGHKVIVRGSGRGFEGWADLRILVPAGRRLSVNVGVGNASVSNVTGDLEISTASGDVTAETVKGELRIDTGSGNVEVTGASGELDLDTGSGDVKLDRISGSHLRIETGSGNVTGAGVEGSDLKVETGSGDVEIQDIQASEAALETGSGNVRAEFSGELTSLAINTGSGDVRATVPEKFSGEIRIDSSSGDDIDIDFPVQLIRKWDSGIRARIGDGTGKIDIETGSGGVTLKR